MSIFSMASRRGCQAASSSQRCRVWALEANTASWSSERDLARSAAHWMAQFISRLKVGRVGNKRCGSHLGHVEDGHLQGVQGKTNWKIKPIQHLHPVLLQAGVVVAAFKFIDQV